MRARLATVRRAALAAVIACAAAMPLQAAPRVVAVGDVHGSLAGLTAILRETGLIDGSGRWAGGDAVLVQTGDLLDRGVAVREVMDLMMRLQGEAAAAGGEVVVLLGNHEQMNLIHAYRDVNPAVYASFAADEPAAARRRAFSRWKAWKEGGPAPEAASRDRFDALYPPGSLAYREALGPEGRYGRWLRTLPVAAVRGGILFMHAGLSPAYRELPLEEIDARHRQTFAALDAARRTLTARAGVPEVLGFLELFDAVGRLTAEAQDAAGEPGPLSAAELAAVAAELTASQWMNQADAPLWFRGFATWSDEELTPHTTAVRERHRVGHVVAAHSTSDGGSIRVRLSGVVFLIDTGMLVEVYGGRPSALEAAETGIFGVYPGERRLLVAPPATGEAPAVTVAPPAKPPRVLRCSDGRPPPFTDEEEILAFLRQAEVVASKSIGEGVTGALKVELRRGAVQLAAAFHDIDRSSVGVRLADKRQMYFLDTWRAQVAAYELARLLGLDTVPPSVERRFAGRRGSLQLWVGEATTWRRLREGGTSPPWNRSLARQWQDMHVFDNLINNRDRNQGNVLVDHDGYLWWIDHTRAFDRQRTLPAADKLRRVSRRFWEGLSRLDPSAVKTRLEPYLGRFEIQALLDRRDLILASFRERIAAQGEHAVLFDGEAALPPEVVAREEPCAEVTCAELLPPP